MVANSSFTLAEQPSPVDVVEMASHLTNIFATVPREVAMIDGYDTLLKPINCDPVIGDIEFTLEQDSMHYIHPKIQMYCKFKITNNGVALAENEEVSLVNQFGTSFFQSCEMRANDMRVTENTSECMHYKNYIETLASNGYDSRMCGLKNSMFYQDTPGFMDTMTSANKGYEARKALIALSRECEFIAPVGLDVLSTDKLFPTRVKFGFRFTRAKPEFYILSPKPAGTAVQKQYRAEILDCYLIIRKIRPSESIIKQHQAMFSQGLSAQYPYCRTVLKRATISKSERNLDWHSAFTGKLPQQIVVVLVDTKAETGHFNMNPFNFQHFGITHASTNINGTMYPSGGYTLDIDNGLYLRVVHELFGNVGQTDNSGIIVTRESFAKGHCLLTWNYNPDKTGSLWDRDGAIDINLAFKSTVDTSVSVLCLGFFEEVMTLNEARDVKTNTRERREY